MRVILLMGIPGSGKSTLSKQLMRNDSELAYVNQDSQGKLQHMENFRAALRDGKSVIVDRMNFNKAQRNGSYRVAFQQRLRFHCSRANQRSALDIPKPLDL